MSDLTITDEARRAAVAQGRVALAKQGANAPCAVVDIAAALAAAAPLIVAAELERIAETLHTSCRMDDLMATIEAGARNGVRNDLLARVRELRSGVSGTGDQQ